MAGTILVVDDVATNRIIMKVKLSAACYGVLLASNGAEALIIARDQRPDLILLDLTMPDMDGCEVCRRLKADPVTADIPVLIVTASLLKTSRLAALAAGAEDFMSKPLDDSILLARLRSALRATSTAAELALRDDTNQALGFSEGPAEAFTYVPQGRFCILTGDADRGSDWQNDLARRLKARVDLSSPLMALRHESDAEAPDVFLITDTVLRPGDGLGLLAELRARPATRHASIVMAVPPEARERAAIALDLGASDIIYQPLDMEETALRLKTQLKRKQTADRLRSRMRDGLQLAVTDSLTGLFNRRYGLSHLENVHVRAVTRNKSYAVLLVDLDRFKSVNDTFGHAAGDSVLRSVAGRLQAGLRNVDLISRIGGEEFMIVMPEIDPESAQVAAERLCRAVTVEPIYLAPGQTLTQTVSIGVAVGGGGTGPDEPSATETMERADRALYRAKSEGRNRTHTANINRSAA